MCSSEPATTTDHCTAAGCIHPAMEKQFLTADPAHYQVGDCLHYVSVVHFMKTSSLLILRMPFHFIFCPSVQK